MMVIIIMKMMMMILLVDVVEYFRRLVVDNIVLPNLIARRVTIGITTFSISQYTSLNIITTIEYTQ